MKTDKIRITQERRIERLEQKVRLFYFALILMAVVMAATLVGNVSQAGEEVVEKDKVIRARGIVIVDDNGRERILLGAPIPNSKSRVRTDLARVKEIWGGRFPDPNKYMEYYKDYRHDLDGMLVLDENGFDRLAVGDRVPDPNIGKRLGSNDTGIIINDENGRERTGYGLLKLNDKYRVSLGLDSSNGQEGLSLILNDEGGVGMQVRDGKKSIFVGNAPARNWMSGLHESFEGLLMKDGDQIKHNLNVAEKK